MTQNDYNTINANMDAIEQANNSQKVTINGVNTIISKLLANVKSLTENLIKCNERIIVLRNDLTVKNLVKNKVEKITRPSVKLFTGTGNVLGTNQTPTNIIPTDVKLDSILLLIG